MATRNKSAGSAYERKIVNELKDKGYNVGTMRQFSRGLDDLKVDVATPPHITEDNEDGKVLPFYIQTKFTRANPRYDQIFSDMAKGKPGLVFHQKSEPRQTKAGVRHYAIGEYVIMDKELFYEMLDAYGN